MAQKKLTNEDIRANKVSKSYKADKISVCSVTPDEAVKKLQAEGSPMTPKSVWDTMSVILEEKFFSQIGDYPNPVEISVLAEENTKKELETNYEFVDNTPHYNQFMFDYVIAIRAIYGDAIATIICDAMAFKYGMRAGFKKGTADTTNDSAVQDIAKRDWYLNYKEEILKNKKNWSKPTERIEKFIKENLNK